MKCTNRRSGFAGEKNSPWCLRNEDVEYLHIFLQERKREREKKRLMNSPLYCFRQSTEGNNWFCQDRLICGLSICSNLAGIQTHWTDAEITFFFLPKYENGYFFPSLWPRSNLGGWKSRTQLWVCAIFRGEGGRSGESLCLRTYRHQTSGSLGFQLRYVNRRECAARRQKKAARATLTEPDVTSSVTYWRAKRHEQGPRQVLLGVSPWK